MRGVNSRALASVTEVPDDRERTVYRRSESHCSRTGSPGGPGWPGFRP